MPNYFEKLNFRYPFYTLLLISVIQFGVIMFFQWQIGLASFLLLGIVIYFYMKVEQTAKKEMETYISTLSYRLKKVGEEALMEMPIGIMLYNDDYQIEWTNPFLASCFHEETLVGRSLYDVGENLIPLLKQDVETEVVPLHDRKYKVVIKKAERLIYFFDVTEQTQIEKQYEEERTVLGIIFLDNYDEVTQGMDDQTKSAINSQVTSIINKWATENGVFLKRTSMERFIVVLNEQILVQLEKNKFTILDEVREQTAKQSMPLTLSVGIGTGVPSLPELGHLAQSSLDLALGRGGDQVAIKQTNGKVRFYGGKTNPMEKRTRVRARVISHALKELIHESDKVIIMGHRYPDMDAIGAAIGIAKVAELNQKDSFIVLNQNEIDAGIQRLLSELKSHDELWEKIISPEEALDMATNDTLLVVVDTHKPSLVIEEKLLNKIEDVVVIDHHRRGEDFIEDPLLVYMEPYASSTAELVTELLQYQPKRLKITMLEATALLAGIIVDTKSFTVRTGSRTFDAASYLRSQGADTILVQKLLKENLDRFVKRAKLIESAYLYQDGIVIAKGNPEDFFDQVMIAQAADTLLAMSDINTSFVIAHRTGDQVSISARSLGDINVQVVMEMLEGGGHLTNAATQLSMTIDEAEEKLKEAIREYLQGGTKE
ncbi:c-di-AMP phosphodiesterase-like protein [Bacillus tianshenii]|uniref:Cyclic-di-AMP phosphodiesterase n=1 Tax=Sutcliffiella tianshenii TaxID=1463404 RepID=A0ABS2NW10_9BACI|nr:DHH family phosphoesterase [Bacillus tianshenii]MBM7618856.1 c-di-AMP phosphodiesterase-like protein [Bacillus tianshenii]MCA1322269.1 DHH family phosphoesterase [Bacillus tianshenii]